jgi:hypothetical protein
MVPQSIFLVKSCPSYMKTLSLGKPIFNIYSPFRNNLDTHKTKRHIVPVDFRRN